MADEGRELGTYWRDKAREILTMYGKHGTDMGLCDSYYCGQECSYLSAVDDQDGNLLREMAGEEWVKEWETRLLEWSLWCPGMVLVSTGNGLRMARSVPRNGGSLPC